MTDSEETNQAPASEPKPPSPEEPGAGEEVAPPVTQSSPVSPPSQYHPMAPLPAGPPHGYPPPGSGYSPLAPGYPPPAPGYPPPAPGYPQPLPGYPQPAPGYPQPAPGYPQPAPGYPQPAPGYPQPALGFNTPPWAPSARPLAGETDSGALWSLILAVLGGLTCGFILSPIAFFLGVSALRRVRASGGALSGEALAQVGKWLGLAGAVVWYVWVIGWLVWRNIG
ncbi:MAG TPA: DUF4190 domain-containing protein [Candidatus Dormibacteraeota bacterium]|nr:DUF4190 domain-containing protein [Candidatus Dormibacteraeota bacterium]